MRYFCTYFDRNYLTRGLALYRSLQRHCPEFCLWVLCQDEETFYVLSRMGLPHARLINLDDFKKNDEELIAAEKNRSRVEFYFTCTPSLLLYIFKNFPEVGMITYLDADLYFFSSVEPLFREADTASIAIIAHRFSPGLKGLVINGIYNVSWLSFRNDQEALKCLDLWRNQCNACCKDTPIDGKFADQKYLDDWLERFKNIVVLGHKGANLAYWNIQNYKISIANDSLYVDGAPLIFFHFHALKFIIRNFYDTGFHLKVPLTRIVKNAIYIPYLKEICNIAKDLRKQFNIDFSLHSIRKFGNCGFLVTILFRGFITRKFIYFNDY